jgi:hypothetical protein
MKRLLSLLSGSVVCLALFAAAPPIASADEDGYGEDINLIFGNRGHHGKGGAGRYWIPRYSGETHGVIIVHNSVAYLRTPTRQYYGRPEYSHDGKQVCIDWNHSDMARNCWWVRKNDDASRQFTANSRYP